MSMEVLYTIDSLVKRGERVFGWGWVIARGAEISNVRMIPLSHHENGIECPLSGEREDVTGYFNWPDSMATGFLIVGTIRSGSLDWRLEIATDIGTTQIPLEQFPDAYITSQPGGVPDAAAVSRRIMGKIARDGVLGAASDAVSRASSYAKTMLAKVKSTRHPHTSSCVLIVDHDMGGGANRFRRELASRLSREGHTIALLIPKLKTLAYRLEWTRGLEVSGGDYSSVDEAMDALEPCHVKQVHLNDLVSFDEPGRLLKRLAEMHDRGADLVSYLNDYYSLCPSWTLTDWQERFCDVPDPETCKVCLPRLNLPFKSFASPGVDIVAWREQWRAYLSMCSQIVAFSEDSKRIFGKGYPDLATKIVVRPHDTDYLTAAREITYRGGTPLRIGVLGHLNAPKGAGVLREMVQIADAQELDIEFVIFGSMERAPVSPRLTLAGAYEPNGLPSLFESHNVAACFLPSICSETYSYVTSEIIHFDMPVAVFPVGAPAERVAKFNKGHVLSTMSPRDALAELRSFALAAAGQRIAKHPNNLRVGN